MKPEQLGVQQQQGKKEQLMPTATRDIVRLLTSHCTKRNPDWCMTITPPYPHAEQLFGTAHVYAGTTDNVIGSASLD